MRFACSPGHGLAPGERVEIVSLEPDLSFHGRIAWTDDRGHVGVEREEPVIFSLERRRYVRVTTSGLTATAGLQTGLRVLDVSLRGLRVETREGLPEEPLQVDLHLPDTPLSLPAVVLESRGSIARLALTEVDENAQTRLSRYLRDEVSARTR